MVTHVMLGCGSYLHWRRRADRRDCNDPALPNNNTYNRQGSGAGACSPTLPAASIDVQIDATK